MDVERPFPPPASSGARWCGIDISPFAIDLITNHRLQGAVVHTAGIPTDLVGARKLAIDHPLEFETWAVSQLPGFAPNTQQRGDGGIDGRATLAMKPDDAPTRLALAQVKGGRFHASHLRDFRHVIERDNAAVGCFVTLDRAPARHRADAKLAGRIHVQGQPYDRLHLWSIAEYFPDLRTPFLARHDRSLHRSFDGSAIVPDPTVSARPRSAQRSSNPGCGPFPSFSCTYGLALTFLRPVLPAVLPAEPAPGGSFLLGLAYICTPKLQ